MATGAFFAAFNYKLYVELGTSSSTIPTSDAGMTRVLSLDNAGIQATSDSTAVLDYDSEFGFQANLITGQSYTIPCSMNLDVTDAGYQTLKQAALEATSGTLVTWYRETPVTDGSGAPNEQPRGDLPQPPPGAFYWFDNCRHCLSTYGLNGCSLNAGVIQSLGFAV